MDSTREDVSERSSTPDTREFPFVGGALALDLVNTEVMVRGRRGDLLTSPQDLAQWWQAARQHHPETVEIQADPAFDGVLLEALRELRSALRGIFSALVEGADPAEVDLNLLNGVLSTGYHTLQHAPGGMLLPAYRTKEPTTAAVLLPVALSAFRLLAEGDHKRLHKCGNGRCILMLYDTTKSATRRWCSVGCKDRTRKMRQYHQAKATGPLA